MSIQVFLDQMLKYASRRGLGWGAVTVYTIACRFNFDPRKGPVQIEWFTGAQTNLCYNAVDRHVKDGAGDRVAFFWEGNDPGEASVTTYQELLGSVCRIANFLKSLGVKKGSDVTLYLPMIPELPAAMVRQSVLRTSHSNADCAWQYTGPYVSRPKKGTMAIFCSVSMQPAWVWLAVSMCTHRSRTLCGLCGVFSGLSRRTHHGLKAQCGAHCIRRQAWCKDHLSQGMGHSQHADLFWAPRCQGWCTMAIKGKSHDHSTAAGQQNVEALRDCKLGISQQPRIAVH